MQVLLSRHGGTGSVLRCVRRDGTETWQKREKHGVFFATHDLTHFAVESILACRQGFFGLVESGWSIEDTTGKGSRGPLPAEEFNDALGLQAPACRPLTDGQLAAMRKRRAELIEEWSLLPPGRRSGPPLQPGLTTASDPSTRVKRNPPNSSRS